MRPNRWAAAILVLVVAAQSTWTPAEVAVEIEGPTTYVLVVGIIEGPDPVPMLIWEPVREVDPRLVLNATGALRGDGRPDADFDPVSGRPWLVWAYKTDATHDIAFATWDGSAWEETRLLTVSSEDDLDPRIFVEGDGNAHVVWWVPGGPFPLRYTTRPAGASGFGIEQTLPFGGAEASRPSLAVWQGDRYVAFERPAASGREIVLARGDGDGAWTFDVVGTTSRTEPLDPTLHVEAGRFWLDWKHDGAYVAFRELNGATWTPTATVPWNDPSWFGEQDARELVRGIVLLP
jgi:hypothetical protein